MPLRIGRVVWAAAAIAIAAAGCARHSDSSPPSPHAAAPSAPTATSDAIAAVSQELAHAEADRTPSPVQLAGATASDDATPQAEAPIQPQLVKIDGDRSVLVVTGETRTPIVYLHGRCGDPTAFSAWARAGRKFGTIISIVGSIKCDHGTRTRWPDDVASIDRRITKAIASVKAELGIDLDDSKRIVMGYSQGSLKAEALANRFPARYPRAVLVSAPRPPLDGGLGKTEAVLLMVGDQEAREPFREAAKKLEKQRRAVRYLELRHAHHGEYGPDAERIMTDGLDWLVRTPTPL